MSKHTGIFRTSNGKKIELTQKETKAFIKNVYGWNSEQYEKEYDKLRNKLRTYERYTGAEKQSPLQVLYREARSVKTYKNDYKRSAQLERIYNFPSYSSGQGTFSLKQKRNISNIYAKYSESAFKSLIDSNPYARKIWDSIDDPIKREQALKDFAKKMHDTLNGKRTELFRSTQAIGSTEYSDFDFSGYL